MNKVCLFCCLAFLWGFALRSSAQKSTAKLDSLLLINQKYHKEDSSKFVLLKNILIQYSRLGNTVKAEETSKEALLIAKKLNRPSLGAAIYYRLGLYYHGIDKYLKAEENYFKSIEQYTLANNLDWVAGNYQSLSALYTEIPDYAKALDVNQKAISIYQKLGDEFSMANCYTNIGILYQSLGQQNKSLEYLNRALKVYLKDSEENRGVAVAYEGIGTAYISASNDQLKQMGVSPVQKSDIALVNFYKALKVAEAILDTDIMAGLHQKIAQIQEIKGDLETALKSYKKSIEEYHKIGIDKNYAYSLFALAKFYHHHSDYNESNKLLVEALQIGKEENFLDLQSDVYQYMSLNEEKLGNYNKSLINFKKHISLGEQIFNEEKEKEITRKRLQLDFTIKENDYQLKQQISDAKLQRQILLAKQQQQQLILRKQELALSNNEKSLQRLTFLKKQADLENEQLQNTLKSKIEKELKDKQINLQQSEIKFNRKLNLFLSALAIILLGTAIFVIYTKRKTTQLNKVVSEQKEELEKLGKVKDRIFSVVSHDMRTPVNSLISFIQLLENGNMEQQKLNKYAAQLKNTLTYTSVMMENLLNWASSQMQGFNPVIEQFDVQICVNEVVNSLKETAAQKNISIHNQVESGKLCFADMNMTALVLRNLMSNAIKFTKEKGVVKVSLSENTEQMLIAISDNGMGLTQEQIENFNHNMFEGNAKTTPGTNNEKGTGIGLLLCKTFTTLMNGSLQVQSQKEIGSVFTLTLPK